MNRYVLILILGIMLCGCGSTRVVTVDVPKIEKEYVVKSDTVRQVDSVFISNDRYVINDTVFVTKVNEKFKYIYKVRVDTVMRTDTITVVDEHKIIEQEKQIKSLENVMSVYRLIGIMMIGVIACLVLLRLFK